MAKKNNATGGDEGIAALEEDGKGGSNRGRRQRGERVFGSGGENLEEGESVITKGTEAFDGEGGEKEGRRGLGVKVAKCLVVFQLVGKVTRGGRG